MGQQEFLNLIKINKFKKKSIGEIANFLGVNRQNASRIMQSIIKQQILYNSFNFRIKQDYVGNKIYYSII